VQRPVQLIAFSVERCTAIDSDRLWSGLRAAGQHGPKAVAGDGFDPVALEICLSADDEQAAKPSTNRIGKDAFTALHPFLDAGADRLCMK
jgi:hypothetical protein